MEFNEREITVNDEGVQQTGDNIPVFLDRKIIPNDTTAYPFMAQMVNVNVLHQTVFNLSAEPSPNGIHSVVINGKTYFEPDFTVRKKKLSWHMGVLPINTKLHFESQGTEQLHRRRQTLVVHANGQRTFGLITVPKGDEVEVYLNGVFYNKASNAFSIVGHFLTWHGKPLTQGDRLVVVYALTGEGALILNHENIRVKPGAPSTIKMRAESFDATQVRVYWQGKRLLAGPDFAVSFDELTMLGTWEPRHGDNVVVLHPTATTYFPDNLGTGGRAPAQVFVKENKALTSDSPTVALALTGDKSLLSVNGLMYGENAGFSRADGLLSWLTPIFPDVLPGVGDELSALGFYRSASNGLTIESVTSGEGYPTLALSTKAADIHKAMVFVSSALGFGGALYAGRHYLSFPDDRHITWAGPYPLTEDDKVVVVYFRDPALAASINVESYQVTLSEDGKPFAHKLQRGAREPHAAIVGMNGMRLVSPRQYVINDNAFNYHNPEYKVSVGDLFTFLYR